MDDLISRSKLMEVFRARMVERYDREKCASDENCKVCKPGCFWRIVISAAPAVDAVPVVRCKDCKYFCMSGKPPFMYHFCTRENFKNGITQDSFCSEGERKDNA